jgi:phage-related protein
MENEYIRNVYVYGTDFWNFYNKQNKKVQDKIDWVISLIRTIELIPEKYLKHLTGTDGLYEIRIGLGNNIFRIFCFFDEGNLIILLNGFQKKSQKTPRSEINKAKKLKDEYYENK